MQILHFDRWRYQGTGSNASSGEIRRFLFVFPPNKYFFNLYLLRPGTGQIEGGQEGDVAQLVWPTRKSFSYEKVLPVSEKQLSFCGEHQSNPWVYLDGWYVLMEGYPCYFMIKFQTVSLWRDSSWSDLN